MSLRVPLYLAILDSTDCWNSIPGALFLTLKLYKILGCTLYKSYFKYLNLVHYNYCCSESLCLLLLKRQKNELEYLMKILV